MSGKKIRRIALLLLVALHVSLDSDGVHADPWGNEDRGAQVWCPNCKEWEEMDRPAKVDAAGNISFYLIPMTRWEKCSQADVKVFQSGELYWIVCERYESGPNPVALAAKRVPAGYLPVEYRSRALRLTEGQLQSFNSVRSTQRGE